VRKASWHFGALWGNGVCRRVPDGALETQAADGVFGGILCPRSGERGCRASFVTARGDSYHEAAIRLITRAILEICPLPELLPRLEVEARVRE
jgi:hypothetical protein